ncbi:TonB-dependent receptor [Hymenobacter weizhouensis]|uniref:TonB-dependent receptor n=1 Tax=Hymenobacter sp. YIM 151500-1 TaxID=2987689 RepID=UPI002226C053|nr:TonB-dependent receptor [Hymenobacter sp. YIM 151500-1]UYZ62074.1 TonB-dependent receptor [Hymenobacter sp. YIM 151500-1]
MQQLYPPVLAALLLPQLVAARPAASIEPLPSSYPTATNPETPDLNISGQVLTDEGQPLPGATVFVKGSFIGTSTNREGKFSLGTSFDNGPVTLVFSYVGYETREIKLEAPESMLNVGLSPSAALLNETVVSASRVEEAVLRAPVTIDKVSQRQLETVTNPEIINRLGYLKGVDVNSASLLFTSVSTRGFNTAKSERLVQLIDYADMQLPSLNFSPGNLVGIPELDMESVEIIHGPASALYGSNALSGVVLFNSRDAHVYEGLTARLRGGERNYLDGQLRYAKKLTEKWAFKVNGSYFRARDWEPKNYDAATGSANPAGSSLGYNAVNRYGDLEYTFTPQQQLPGGTSPELYGRTATLPGFTEGELIADDKHTTSYRLQGSVSYLIKQDLKATVEAKRAAGTSTYQNLSRIRAKGVGINQYKAELKSSRGFVRLYSTEDFSGDSYDLVYLGSSLQASPTAEGSPVSYAATYFATYNAAYKQARNAGASPDQALQAAQNAARGAQLSPSDPRFTTLRQQLVNSTDLTRGAKVNFNSFLNDASAQYSFRLPTGTDLVTGAAYREYRLGSDGLLFSDTPGKRLRNYEYGAYAQLTHSLLDNRLRLSAAGRVDEFKNFKPAFSPRVSAVATVGAEKQHNFRISYASAFRSPSQIEQYSQVEGLIRLQGNLGNGYQGYTLVNAAGQRLGTPGAPLSSFEFSVGRLDLERANTYEVGYKGALLPRLYLDVNYFNSRYQDFIGGQAFIGNIDGTRPTLQQLAAGQANNFQAGQSTRLLYAFYNNNQTVRTQGAAAGLTYYALKSLNLSANYSLNVLNRSGLPEDFQTFFNTPKHKYNVGAEGQIGQRLRYNLNYRWVQGHLQETYFATGRIADYSSLDGYVGYTLPKLNTTFQAGATNLLNSNNVQVYGGPQIGRLAYVGLLVNVK